MLAETLKKFDIQNLSDDEKEHFNRVWHRLKPWPDSVPGLQRLKSRFVITTLSNGNISLLTNMAKHAGLPWDCILSAENVRHYKPDPRSICSRRNSSILKPEQVMMVAAHEHDLQSARKHGLRTAFVHRPMEHGPGKASADSAQGPIRFRRQRFPRPGRSTLGMKRRSVIDPTNPCDCRDAGTLSLAGMSPAHAQRCAPPAAGCRSFIHCSRSLTTKS